MAHHNTQRGGYQRYRCFTTKETEAESNNRGAHKSWSWDPNPGLSPLGCFHVLTASCASCHQVLAPSPEAGCRAATSTSGRRGLLWRLRDKQARLGLFEIGPGHELHQLTCMMQAGLWAATQVSMDHPPTVSGPSVPCTSSVPRARPRGCQVLLILQGRGSERAIKGGNQGLGAGRDTLGWGLRPGSRKAQCVLGT